MAVDSTRGEGLKGHLATVTDTTTYEASFGSDLVIDWTVPVHPGTTPTYPPGTKAAEIAETNRQYAADMAEYKVIANTEKSIKAQVLAEVPPTYLSILRNLLFGYASVAVLTMLNHLQSTYGRITDDDLAANLDRMDHPWSPDQPIEDVWEAICLPALLPRIMTPSLTQSPSAAITNFHKSGVLEDACREWRKLPVAERTYSNAVFHFREANDERLRILTAGKAGYHSVAVVTPTEPSPAFPANSDQARFGYCPTHGITFNHTHTSATCKNPGPNHQRDATFKNMKGGNNRVQQRRSRLATATPSTQAPLTTRTATPIQE